MGHLHFPDIARPLQRLSQKTTRMAMLPRGMQSPTNNSAASRKRPSLPVSSPTPTPTMDLDRTTPTVSTWNSLGLAAASAVRTSGTHRAFRPLLSARLLGRQVCAVGCGILIRAPGLLTRMACTWSSQILVFKLVTFLRLCQVCQSARFCSIQACVDVYDTITRVCDPRTLTAFTWSIFH